MSEAPLIHVVDEDESFRTAQLRLLHAAGFEAIGYASTAEFLLNLLPDRPGCVLLDLLDAIQRALARDTLQRTARGEANRRELRPFLP